MIDLTGYRLTFDDEFNQLSVSATGSGTVWADTRPDSLLRPGVDIGFGQSAFVDSSTGIQPFSITNGALRIEAAPATGAAADLVYPGLWSSGLIHAAETFSQTYGYFEMRADLPEGAGSWPGFWLLAADGHWPPELDIVETFGADPTTLTNSVHTGQTGEHTFQTVWTNQPTLSAGFHTFGALWTPTTITFYYDGTAIGELATPADMHGAMYPVIALAMSRGVEGTTDDPRSMLVDYVRAYSADPSATAVALQHIASPDGADTSDLHGAVAATVGPPASGSDTLTFHVSGDLWNGGPEFTVTVDGQRVGGIFEVTADHGSGARQDISLTGDFGAGPHVVAVTYINDGQGQPVYDPATGWHMNDRNLYVSGFSFDGAEHGVEAMTANNASGGCDWLDTQAAVFVNNGTATFAFKGGSSSTAPPVVTPTAPPVVPVEAAPSTPVTTTPPTVPVVPCGSDTLTFHVSGDLWNGGPAFTVTVDGARVGGTYEVSADHGAGARQDVTLTGAFGSGPHTIAVEFVNDAAGTPVYDPETGWHMNDRNLYVSGFSFDGTEHGVEAMTVNYASRGCDWLDPHAAVLVDNGSVLFHI
ncbi:family 16 glycosylhydrolase [Methylobacterium sp. C25]|uniref:carbohydrate-binding domain-containing protein n=1 Tax=Methylobacterium sp. C25 TaxID=2721622 RepID=UPI001F3DE439|nr:carbohydrate-binding domain-containing protein [Methylobacterium sp. C25]MCE4225132.1 family 16 glycosylhydrolase [Methylobacterium sp. C25]